MPEQLKTNPELTTREKNEALLANSELGVLLVDAYRTACDLDPRMEEVEVVPITNPDDIRHGYARPKWSKNNESGRHEVHVRLDDLQGTLGKYQEAMTKVKPATDIIARRLGVDPSMATPQLMYVHSVMHEFGHTGEFMDHEGDPAALLRRQKQEKAALPIGNASIGALVEPGTPARRFVDDNWDRVQEGLDVSSLDELVTKQSEAYRSMTSEAYADNFATDVFLTNPQLYDQLTNSNMTTYTNSPTVA